MSDLVEKVAREIVESMGDTPESAARAAIAAVLEHLADNVSDEMAEAWTKCDLEPGKATHGVIAAALRAAAGSAPTTPEVKK